MSLRDWIVSLGWPRGLPRTAVGPDGAAPEDRRVFDPPEGYLASANEIIDRVGQRLIHTHDLPPYRKHRIVEQLHELNAATLEDIEAVGKSYGTTWHLPLTMAMNLEPAPKNVYFLTDGETARQDQVAEEMVEMAKARGNTKLNTIALMVPGASVPLHRMAVGTGGEYSLVIAGGKVLKDDELREYLAEKDIALND